MTVLPSPIFNATSSTTGITKAYADSTYLKIAGGQTVTALETFAGGISTTNLSSSGSVSGSTIAGGSLAVSGNVTVDTDTFFVDSVNNRVGIKKTNPGYELDVTGYGNFSTGLSTGGAITGFTSLPTLTSSHIGYTYLYKTGSALTLTTTQQTYMTSDVNLGVGVWLINYSIRVSIANGATANQTIVALYLAGGQTTQTYKAIPANASGSTVSDTITDSYVYSNSSSSVSVAIQVSTLISTTSITCPANSDARFARIIMTRIA